MRGKRNDAALSFVLFLLSLSFSFRIFHLFVGRNDSSFISREKKTKKIFSSGPLKAKSLGVLVDGETVAPFQEAR